MKPSSIFNKKSDPNRLKQQHLISATKLLHKSISFALQCITLQFEKAHQGMQYKSGLVFVGNFQLKRTEFKKGNIHYNVYNFKQVVRI